MGLSGAGVHLSPAGLSEGIRNKYLQTGHSLTVNCGVDRCNVANYCTLIMSLSMLKKISERQRHPTSERSEDAASAGGTPGRAAQPPARGGARGAQRGGPGRGASAVWWGGAGGRRHGGGEMTGAGPGRLAASRAGACSAQTLIWADLLLESLDLQKGRERRSGQGGGGPEGRPQQPSEAACCPWAPAGSCVTRDSTSVSCPCDWPGAASSPVAPRREELATRPEDAFSLREG